MIKLKLNNNKSTLNKGKFIIHKNCSPFSSYDLNFFHINSLRIRISLNLLYI